MLDSEQLVRHFSEALGKGKGVFFVGSGISTESGFPSWEELLSSFCKSVYTIAQKKELPLVAQYIVTESGGHDFALKSYVADKLRIAPKKSNKFLQILTRTGVDRIWTTNYDTLIEEEFGRGNCTVNFGDHNIDKGADHETIEIVKMHGCRTDVRSMVLTQDDYDFYPLNNPNTCRRLLSDMSEKVFLFIGYGFRDQDIHSVIRASQWHDRTRVKRHFLITRAEKNEPDSKLQGLWAKNLMRYGIQVCFVDKHDDVAVMLQDISLKSRGKRVYVTGSHDAHDDDFSKELGVFFAQEDGVILLDGQSSGRSANVLTSFNSKNRDLNKDAVRRIESFHNPYAVDSRLKNDVSLISSLKKHREPLLRRSQLVVLFDGGMGTEAEFDVAVAMGCNIIPVPISNAGSGRSALMDRVLKSSSVTSYLDTFPEYAAHARGSTVTPSILIDCLKIALSRFS